MVMVLVCFIPCALPAFRLVFFLGCFFVCVSLVLSADIQCKKCEDANECQNPEDKQCGRKDDYYCGSTWMNDKADSMVCVRRDDVQWNYVGVGKCAHDNQIPAGVNAQRCICDNEDFCNSKMQGGGGIGGGNSGGNGGSKKGSEKGSGSISKSTSWTYLMLLIVASNSCVLFKGI